MNSIVYFILAIIGIFLLIKVLSWPIKIFTKLLLNAILGLVLLVITNFLGTGFGISLAINLYTVLIAGFLGIPGVIFLIVFKFYL